MRFGPRQFFLTIAVVALAAGSLAAGRDSARSVSRWQGPFEYVREFDSAVPGCAFHGREIVNATVACEGADLLHLRCSASGIAEHSYRENVAGSERSDSGSYSGVLRADYDSRLGKDAAVFRLDVGAPVAVQYRSGDKSGQYVVDVAASTQGVTFNPQSLLLERSRTEPIYEPGPAACATSGPFNGKQTISLRLAPAE